MYTSTFSGTSFIYANRLSSSNLFKCKSSIFPLSLSMFISHIYPLNHPYYEVVIPPSSVSISSSSASSCGPPTVNSAQSKAAIASIHILRYSNEFLRNACPVLRIATLSPISYLSQTRQALLSEIYQVDRTYPSCFRNNVTINNHWRDY